eukprot:9015650-Karenia_brevis.AAC.1
MRPSRHALRVCCAWNSMFVHIISFSPAMAHLQCDHLSVQGRSAKKLSLVAHVIRVSSAISPRGNGSQWEAQPNQPERTYECTASGAVD